MLARPADPKIRLSPAVRPGQGNLACAQGTQVLPASWQSRHCPRAAKLAETSGDSEALLRMAVAESGIELRMGNFQTAAGVALRGAQAARETGREAWSGTTILIFNAAEALFARGHTAEAAALIDPLTGGPPDRDH
jgi:hypothetical protein